MGDLLECPFTDVVSLSEAADELGVSVSTISRNVRDGIIPNRGTVREPKVSIEEARRRREAHLDHAMSRRSSPPAALNDHRATHERIKAAKAAIELAAMQGKLVRKAEVDEFLATEAGRLRDSLLRRWRALATEFAGMTAREIEERGRAEDESLLAALAAEYEALP